MAAALLAAGIRENVDVNTDGVLVVGGEDTGVTGNAVIGVFENGNEDAGVASCIRLKVGGALSEARLDPNAGAQMDIIPKSCGGALATAS